ncbi:MAG: SspB family protein [Paracoccaceae bacterium]
MTMSIDYGNLMHRAMRGLIHEVLAGVQQSGLPGTHHFFVTFDTRHPGALLADWLRHRYPDEMTIVIQHWFEGFAVDPDGFAITLNFGDQPEPLYIPFDAIRTFVDPSVEFGLRFETQSSDDEPSDEPAEDVPSDPQSDAARGAPQRTEAEVVSLDKWRK